ncbi:MAG: ABC transporter permease [Gemmataceae bacterium]
MWFGTMILKNIVRRPLRSLLTITAIAIAICSVVSLVGIASGFEDTFRQIYKRKNVDIIVLRAGAKQRVSSSLPERLGERIRELPGVKDVIPGLVDMISLQQYGIQMVLLQGWVPETPVFSHLEIIQGRVLNRADQRAVMLGHILSKNLGKSVGETIQLLEDGETFEIVGIHKTGNTYEDGAMIISLHELQKIMDRKGQVTGYSVILDEESKRKDSKLVPTTIETIQKMEKNINAMETESHIGSMTEIQIVKAMSWLTSAIALAIGLFGVMNTMVMAVSERTREIGILRAVGWRPRRVMRLVLLEAIVMSLIGALVGMVGALALVHVLTRFPTVAGLINANIHPIFFIYGLLLAAGVGLIGGILPARRAAAMLPTAALRQE